MGFAVKEIFYSLQGEGLRTGRPAVFCRFSGCNLWSGREADRATALCRFCDTDFVGADQGVYDSAEAFVQAVSGFFPQQSECAYTPYVVLTGGEPALQLTADCVRALQRAGFEVAVETNGTLPLPPGIDWITVSPKAGPRLVVTSGNELKLVWPQQGINLADFEQLDFDYFFLQPLAGKETAVREIVALCLDRPLWRLSLQTHTILGIR